MQYKEIYNYLLQLFGELPIEVKDKFLKKDNLDIIKIRMNYEYVK